MKNNNKNKSNGFSLVELLVTISVILIVTTVVWVNYSQFNKSFALERSANQTAQEIRGVLEKSLSAETPENVTVDNFKGGYGVFFEIGRNYYTSFIDLNDNGLFDGGSEFLKEISLEEGVSILNIQTFFFGGSLCSEEENNIIFLSPDPTVFIGGKDVDENSKCDYIEITITHDSLGEEKKISVNRSGLISLEE